MFQIGDFIIYGTNGVCRVESIGSVNVPGAAADKQYYTLSPVRSPGGHIYTPVDNQRIVMRPILTRDETERLIHSLPDITPLNVSDEKNVEALYKHSLNSCDSVQWVRVIKTIRLRKERRIQAGKKITAVDDRYMRIAEENFYGELSVVLNKDRSEILSYIHAQVEQPISCAQ